MTPAALAARSCGAGTPPALLELEAAVIAWCGGLRQVVDAGTRGFVAWFRVRREDVDLVARGDFAAVRALPLEVVTGGPVLVVADAAGAGWAPRMVRILSKLPGVEEVVAIRRGRVRRHRVARCRG